MSSPHSGYSSGSSRSPASYARTPSRSSMPGSDENLSPRSSPSSSCSLSTLLKSFSGPKFAPAGRRSVFAKSGLAKRRGNKGRTARKPSRADRRYATEVIDLSSDEEMDTSDIEFLEEVIDISGDDDSECEVLKHIVKGRNRKLMSDAGDESEETSYPISGSSGSDGGSPFVDLSSGSISPFSFGSPLSSLHSMSPRGTFGSGEADLPASDESYDGSVFEFSDSEEMVVEITPMRPEYGDQDGAFQGESEVPAAMVCEDEELVQGDQEVPTVQGDQEVSTVQGDQEVPTVQKDQDGNNDDAGQNDGVAGQGELVLGDHIHPVDECSPSKKQDVGSDKTGPDGGDKEEAPEAMQIVPVTPRVVVASPDDFDCPIDDKCVLEENLSVDHAVFLHKVDDAVTPFLDD